MKTARIATAALCVALGGCFSPSVPAESQGMDDSGGGTDTEGPSSDTDAPNPSGTGNTGNDTEPTTDDTESGPETEGPDTETDSTADTDSTDDTGGGVAPTVELTVNSSDAPDTVEQASEILVQAEVDDVDGSVESVEILFDGRPVPGPVVQNGDTFTTRFIISGADDNGTHLVEATATDNDGLTGDDSVNLEYDLPNGGLIEGWNFDNGTGGNVLGLHPNDEGDELVWIGQLFNGNNQQARTDRIVGPPWQENTGSADDLGADIYPLASGGYVAATAAGDAFNLETRIRRFASNGTTMSSQTFDGSDNGESNWPLGIETDDAGDNYVLGVFVGPDQFESFLLKTNGDLTQEWKRSLSSSPETDGMPFVYDFDVRSDGRIVLAGAETSRMWLATLSADGELEDQLTLVSEFDQSIAYDVTWTPSGDIVVAGTANEGSDWSRLIRMYDDTLSEQWTVDGPANGDFAMAVTADDHGHIAVASTENCNFDGVSRFIDCRLVLRSYDEEGTLRWQHNAEDGNTEFLGPLLFRPGAKADIEVDRYGYVYVSAFHERPIGGGETRSEWWAERHHP